jgi:hypothetical protein
MLANAFSTEPPTMIVFLTPDCKEWKPDIAQALECKYSFAEGVNWNLKMRNHDVPGLDRPEHVAELLQTYFGISWRRYVNEVQGK